MSKDAPGLKIVVLAKFLFALILLIVGIQTPSFALDKANDVEKFFAFVDAGALSSAEQKNLSENLRVKSMSSWEKSEKLRIEKTLQSLIGSHRHEIEALFYNETIRLFRTHDALSADRNQNSSSEGAPPARSSEHDLVLTDDYFINEKKNTDEELLSFFAHELGHVVDAEAALSTSRAWVNSELPKLNRYHTSLAQNALAKHKVKKSTLVKICALPSEYGSRNLAEDFAETYSQFLCAKKVQSLNKYSVLQQVLQKSQSTQRAFGCSVLAARADARDEHKKAVEYMDEAIKLCPNVGTFYDARMNYRKPDNSTLIHNENLKDLEKAAQIYKADNLPTYDTNLRAVHTGLARDWGRLGQYKKQKLELLWLVKFDPDDVDALIDLSDCCIYLNDSAGALSYANKAVNADVLSAGAYRARAGAKMENKNYSSALKDLKLALLIEPENTWALFHESACFYYSGQYDLTRKLLAKVLSSEPKHLEGTRALCLLDFETADYERCITDCDKANAIKKRVNVDAIKAYALVKLSKFEQGRSLIYEALKGKIDDNRDVANAYLCLAEAEIGLKHKPQALRALQTGEKLQPDNSDFEKLRKVISAMK